MRYWEAAIEPRALRALLSFAVLRAASSRRASRCRWARPVFSFAPLYCSVAASASSYSRSTLALTWAGVRRGSAEEEPSNAVTVAAPASARVVAAVRTGPLESGRCLGFRCFMGEDAKGEGNGPISQ